MTKQVFRDAVAAIITFASAFLLNHYFIPSNEYKLISSLIAGGVIFVRGKIMEVFKGEEYEPIIFSSIDSASNGAFTNIIEHSDGQASHKVWFSFCWNFGKELPRIPTITIDSSDLYLKKPNLKNINPSLWNVWLDIEIEFDPLLNSSARNISFKNVMDKIILKADAADNYGSIKKLILKFIGVRGF